ncbi:MAG TPA: DUF3168 domain-containing protein [Caulobacterales bacterium]|nr:DUF3168 domain-containing protein [Caulobacterales bacterium]
MSADRALAAALRAAACADGAVKALLGDPARFYDDPPPDPMFPYATLGRIESQAADVSGVEAIEHAITLHVWSRYGGRAEAIDAISALRAALHDQAIAVEGRRLVYLLAAFTDVFRSGDGRTTHGVLRLRALTEPA